MVRHQPADVRRRQLFEAALQVCSERGYHATRIEDIVKRAGLSKGSLYHHFDSKRDLFLKLFESMMDEYRQMVTDSLRAGSSAKEALRAMVVSLSEMFLGSQGLLQGMLEFCWLGLRDPEIRRHFMVYYEELAEVTARLIERGMEQGEFARDLDSRKLAWTFLLAGDGLVFLHLIFEQPREAYEGMSTLLEVFLRALARDRAAGRGSRQRRAVRAPAKKGGKQR